MAKINLFYLSPNTTGGWVTYTAHLMDALKAAGHMPFLKKIGNKTETKERDFGYGKRYQNLSPIDAYNRAKKGEACLIIAAAKNFKEHTEQLLRLGAHIVIHDPTEFNNVDQSAIEADRCVVIRKVGLEHVPGATFIRHPYTRQFKDAKPKNIRAVATSRIDFDKNTTIILDANRALKAAKQEPVRIYGFENRLYTKFKVVPNYPEWEQSKCAYPREKDAAFNLLLGAKYLVDMSVIKKDGGGTQYTTLEAWDAGACPVIHSHWIRKGDDMIVSGSQTNCAEAGDGQELAAFLSGAWTEKQRMAAVAAGRERLDKLHAPGLIGAQYAKFLGLED